MLKVVEKSDLPSPSRSEERYAYLVMQLLWKRMSRIHRRNFRIGVHYHKVQRDVPLDKSSDAEESYRKRIERRKSRSEGILEK